MPFGLLSFKRKFLVTMDPTSIIANSNSDDCNYPRKRMRMEESASIAEAKAQHLQNVCTADKGETLPQETKEEIEELKVKLKEYEDTSVRVKKEAERSSTKLKKLQEEAMCCMVCHEIIQTPQTLQCGHSACYTCLRKWWTRPSTEDDGAPIIDTEVESDPEEVIIATDEPNPTAPEPRPRRRHRFSSVVNREKRCPYCNEVLKHRPVPNFRIRNTLESMNRHPTSIPQARMDSRRMDRWHGMFYPANETYREPLPAHVIAAEEHIAAQERERDQAFADGRAAGAVEVRTERARANEARRRAAMPLRLTN